MIIVVGGMYRSGSTFAFNVVRECMARQGGAMTLASNSLDPDHSPGSSQHVILKTHRPDQRSSQMIVDGAAKCVCTYRRPEDAVASWMRAFGSTLEKTIELMVDWLEWHRALAKYTLNIRYEDVDRRPLQVIFQLQRWILGRTEPWEAFRVRHAYDKRRLKARYDRLLKDESVADIGFSYYDRKTFFHRRHIASLESQPASVLLGVAELAQVRAALAAYVDEDGNYRP